MIRLTRPDIRESDMEAVRGVLESGMLVQGPRVRAFEEALARTLGVEDVVAVGSGTAALHLALLALGISEGDEVLVPDFTFPATANAVIHCGATPVLVDVEEGTFGMDLEAAEESVTPATRAVLPVHAFGRPADPDSLRALSKKHGLLLVEDAACALGSSWRGQACGTAGDAGCFSFHPRKNLTTAEGGAVVSPDPEVRARVRSLRSHGSETDGVRLRFEAPGFNYRMTEMGAALGIGQIDRLEEGIRLRAERVSVYRERLALLEGVRLPPPFEEGRECHQSLVVMLEDGADRDRVIARMRDLGVETTIGTYALHREPLFQRAFGYRSGQLPRSDRAFRQSLTLPLHAAMSLDEVGRVCDALAEALRG